MPIVKVGSLEIEADARTVNKTLSRIQDLFIICLFIILIFAFLGFTGSGFYANKKISDATHTLSADIPKYLRTEANSSMQFLVNTAKLNLQNNTLILYVDQTYIKHFLIKQILPEPYSIQANNNKIYYYFHSNAKEPTFIYFFVEPIEMGCAKGVIGVENKEIMLNQIIYP